MKKVLILILSLFMIISLTSCSSNSSAEQDSKGESIEVDSKLTKVIVTIPAAFFAFSGEEEITQEYIDSLYADKGYKSVVLNEDGSVSIEMSKAQHQEMLDSYKKDMVQTINDMVEDETYSFEKIEYNNNFTHFKVSLNKNEIGFIEAISSITLYLAGVAYNTLDGKESSKVEIEYYGPDGTLIENSEFEGTLLDLLTELSEMFNQN